MADTIVDGTLFNVENIRYSAPKAGGSGGKSINILNKSTNSGIRLSTPLMLTWGASDFVDEKTGKGNGKFDMSLQFPSSEYKTEDTEAFLANMMAFEAKIKADALTNTKDWFGKIHKTAEVVEALYSPMLKYSKDKHTGEPDMNKSPVLRVKLPIWEGIWKCEIYDEDDNKLFPNPSNPGVSPLDFILKGTNVAVLMQCGGLWFANGKFGCTWKLIQAVVQRPKASLSGQCFIKLKPTDKAKLKSATAPDTDPTDGPVTSTVVYDSDDEEQDEEEPSAPEPVSVFVPPAVVAAPTPAPAPASVPVEEPKKVVKKIIKKKVDA